MGSINKCEIVDGQKVLTPFVQTNSIEDYYSTEEEATNKVWIDGKRIYRRVFQLPSPVRLENGQSTNLSVSTAIAQLLIGSTVGYRYNNANNKVTNPCCCYYSPSDSKIFIYNIGYDYYCEYVILEYTKTTD